MIKVLDRVKETTLSTGVNAITLEGSTQGFRSFDDALDDGDQVYYCIEDGYRYEIGIGTYGLNFNDSYWNNVVTAIPCDGVINGNVFDDLKGRSVTAVGNTFINTGGKFGTTCAVFDGEGDYLRMNYAGTFSPLAQSFTIEAWLYLTGDSPQDNDSLRHATIVAATQSAINTWWRFSIVGDGTTTGSGLRFACSLDGVQEVRDSTMGLSKNVWHHVAVSVNPSGVVFAVDGAVEVTSPLTQNVISSAAYMTIGAETVPLYEHGIVGRMDDIRFTIGTARYIANYELPDTPLREASRSLARDTVLQSTNNNFYVAFPAGTKTVFATAPGKMLQILSGDVSYTVGALECDYTTVSAAIADLATYKFAPYTNVTLNVQDEVITEPLPIELPDLSPAKSLTIKGQNLYSTTMTSVESTSGASGGWSIVVNLSSIANIVVGDYLQFRGCTGGTNPHLMDGCHEVTAIDIPNLRVTVVSKAITASAPSGAINCSVKLARSVILQTTQNSLFTGATGGTKIKFQNIVLKYTGSGSGSSEAVGVVGSTEFDTVGIVGGWNVGISSKQASNANLGTTSTGVIVEGAINGIRSSESGNAVGGCLVSGCTVAIYAESNGSISEATYGWNISGNTTGLVATSGGRIDAVSGTETILNNTTAMNPTANAFGNNGGIIFN